MVVQGGGAVSYGRGTPACTRLYPSKCVLPREGNHDLRSRPTKCFSSREGNHNLSCFRLLAVAREAGPWEEEVAHLTPLLLDVTLVQKHYNNRFKQAGKPSISGRVQIGPSQVVEVASK